MKGMKFFQTLKLPKSAPSSSDDNLGFTWTQLLSPLPSPISEGPLTPYSTRLSPGTESWSAPSPSSIDRPKRPTSSFFRASSYRSERSAQSGSSRATSRSREPDKPAESGFPFPVFDPDGAIFATPSPYMEDSGDEGLAFEHLRGSTTLRVIIVGSGFGGLSTAVACARRGFAVTVVERSNGRAAHGDSILFGPNATRLFYKWDIGKEMYRRSSRNVVWIFHDKMGREVYREILSEVHKQYGAPICQGKRSQFIGILGTEALLLGVKFRYEATVTGYSDAEEPAVILQGGEIIRGDVVVVADGAKSVSRTLLATPGIPPVPRRSSGYSIFRAIVNITPALRGDELCGHFCDGNIRFWLGLDSHVEIWPMNETNELAFTFTHPDVAELSTLNSSKSTPISTVLEEICEWDPALRACIKKFPKALNWTIQEDSIEPRWISNGGKIVFAGDAIHPLSPASFHAGTQAVEDGATIAICLALSGATPDKVPIALKVYERLRKGRTEQAGKLGRRQQRILHTYIGRKSSAARPLDPSAPRGSECTTHSEILRPLAFQLFEFDAEQHAIDNYESTVEMLERESRENLEITRNQLSPK